MNTRNTPSRLALMWIVCLSTSISATGQIGRIGINTATPAAMLHVKDSSVVFTATLFDPSSPPPVSGPGIRMMWYPARGAFRAGGVSGVQWNRSEVGFYSFASGYNTTAYGDRSFATGMDVGAYGDNSFAAGIFSLAEGENSFATGNNAFAIGAQSFASGDFCGAYGDNSFATGLATLSMGAQSFASGYNNSASETHAAVFGSFTIANSPHLFAIGRYNDTLATNPDWSDSDHLFVIGNGSEGARRNAVTVLKGGNVGITTTTPKTRLHITGGIDATHADPTSGYVVLGMTSGVNMVIDDDEILARNNGGGSTLHLQSGGGDLALCQPGGSVGVGNAAPSSKLHVTGGAEADLISNGFLQLGLTSTSNLVIDENEILARNNGATSLLQLQASGGNLSLCELGGNVGVGNTNPSARLNITGGVDAGFGSNGYLQLGSTSTSNLVIDNNEILARNNGLATDLSLQRDGGDLLLVELGGNVAIGNDNPAAKLHVTGGGQITNYSSPGYTVLGLTTTNNLVFDFQQILARNNGAAATLFLQSLGGNLSLCTGGGKVTVGNVAATEEFNVNGDGVFTGTVTASCGLLTCSDIRYKTNIHPIENALQRINALQGITYDWDRKKFPQKDFSDRHQIGISAQELEKVYPEMVFTDDSGYKTVDYSRLTPVLIEAVKELSAEVEELKKMIVEMQR